ncbi:hypothetical protein JCM33374_g3091 [Metschnikowia sp. JCM 33374]|nr:hypothetical protein JCM33374_g3091 [Metschnikowia sp. JCM 33374]
MVSFDSELDVSSPGVELLRSPRKSDFNANATSQSRIPILIPIAVYSVEHLMKVIPKPESELGNLSTAREAEWRLRLLSVFISNRHNIFENQEEDLFSANYGKRLGVLEELLFSWDKSEPSSPYKWLDRYTKQVSTNTSGDKLKSRLYANNLSSLGHTFTNNTNGWDAASQGKFDEGSVNDYTSFKRQMARFLNARLDQVETLKANALTNIIPRLREQEAKRQEEIDHDEEQVGENYRKLRKLNEEVLVVDKRFNRVENDHHKLQESVAETQQMFDHLQELLLNKSDDEITKIMSEQETLLEQLEREKTVLTDESKGLTDEIEVAREEYQEKSTHAIQVAEKLSVLKDKQISLRKKVEGPGMSILPSLAKKDEISAYEMHLRRITQETGFLGDLFTSRLDKLVKERNLMVDTTTPTTGSRQNHRISRAATPL